MYPHVSRSITSLITVFFFFCFLNRLELNTVRFRLPVISSKEWPLIPFDWLTERGIISASIKGEEEMGRGEGVGGSEDASDELCDELFTLLQVHVPYASRCSPQPFSEKEQHAHIYVFLRIFIE